MDNNEHFELVIDSWFDDVINVSSFLGINYPMRESDLVVAVGRVYDEFSLDFNYSPSYTVIESIMSRQNDQVTQELLQLEVV